MSLAESTVSLGQPVQPDDSPAVYYYDCGGVVTYACAQCGTHVTTVIGEEFGKRHAFLEQHKDCAPPWGITESQQEE